MRNLLTTTLVLTMIAGLAMACGSNTPAAPEDGAGGAAGSQNSGGSAGATDAGGVAGNQGMDATAKVPYPDGPYGWEKGSVIKNLRWYGWRDPKAADYDISKMEVIQMSDMYDPDGTKGIKAIFLNVSALWCSACQSEQGTIAYQKDKWGPKGVAFLGTLFEGNQGVPATKENLQTWAKLHKIDWNFVVDPSNKLGPMFDVNATPMNAFIDAKTMKIISVVTGVPDQSWWSVTLDPVVNGK